MAQAVVNTCQGQARPLYLHNQGLSGQTFACLRASMLGKASGIKPGLGLLLETSGSSVSAEIAIATAAAAAALAIPGVSHVPASADAALLPGIGQVKAFFSRPHSAPTVDFDFPLAPKSFTALYNGYELGVLFAKNVGIQLLMTLNFYLIDLHEHDYQKIVAEEQCTIPPEAPKLPSLDAPLQAGLYAGARELAVKTVRLTYEHILYEKLGHAKSEPFLRDGFKYLSQKLSKKHAESSTKQKLFSYTFAMLHANAMLYAAEATVAFCQYSYRIAKNKRKTSGQKAVAVVKSAVFQVGRCSLLLVGSSFVSGLGTLAKPGIGTKAGLLAEPLVNFSMGGIGRSILAP